MKKNSIKIVLFSISFLLSIAVLFCLFSNPLSSSKSVLYMLLLAFLAICVNLGLGILKDFIDFAQNKWVFYIIQWILTILVPISLIVLVEHPLQKKIMADISKKIEPSVKYIKNYKKENNKLPKDIRKENDIEIKYYHTNKFFMLSTDIYPNKADKETIYFNSKDNKWYRFYNNQYEYYKDKKIIPPNLKNYIWFMKHVGACSR